MEHGLNTDSKNSSRELHLGTPKVNQESDLDAGSLEFIQELRFIIWIVVSGHFQFV
jgi:hypothetical protein